MTNQGDNAGVRAIRRNFVQESVALVGAPSTVVEELEQFLIDAGFDVCRNQLSMDTLQFIDPDDTDIILVDVCQHQDAGFDFCRKLKEGNAHRDIPVVFVGDAATPENRLEGFRCGGIDYINYPLHGEEFILRMQSIAAVFRTRRELLNIQEELRISKDSLRLAHTIARLGHWEWEVGSDVVRWSDEAYRILGFAPHECKPSHDVLLQRVHPDERERVTEHFSKIHQSGNFDLEFRILLPNGSSRILHGRGQVACLNNCRYPHIFDPSKDAMPPEQATFIGVIQDVTERKEIEQRLEIEAHTDALTGCARRQYFLELAQLELEQQRQRRGALSLLMLDLDHFKRINDTYGHHVGDLTLQTLADICRDQLRDNDVIGRLGGEEFAVMLPHTSLATARSIAERLRLAIDDAVVPFSDGIQFTASIGVAEIEEDETAIAALLYRADRALYAAKQGGRNRVCVDIIDK